MTDKMVKFCIGSNFSDSILYLVFYMGEDNIHSPLIKSDRDISPSYWINLDMLKQLATNLLEKIKEMEEENKE